MSYSVCVIDDSIPAAKMPETIDDAERLNRSNLKLLLTDSSIWDDENIKSLMQQFAENLDTWNLSAFTNPDFFKTCCKNELYRPDVIILDYDFPSVSDKNWFRPYLLELLNNKFVIVSIYTGADAKQTVEQLLMEPDFNQYKERVFVLPKEGDNSAKTLLDKINTLYENSFSCKFGKELKHNAIDAIDKILIDLGKVTLNDVSNYFKITQDTTSDLIDFVAERFRNQLSVADFSELPTALPENTPTSVELCEKLWSHRLYFYSNSSDKKVRKGDIIVNNSGTRLFLVISATCDLSRCWHKNFGRVNVIPLHRLDKTNKGLIEKKLLLTRKKENVKDNLSQKSLTTSIEGFPEGPFILPFLKIQDKFNDFIGFPKEIMSLPVKKPANITDCAKLKDAPLDYDHWSLYKKLCSISEPFQTPLVELILSAIAGCGVPDYPEKIKEAIKERSRKIFE